MPGASKVEAAPPQDLLALRRRGPGGLDADALGRLGSVQRMQHNSLTVVNLNTGNHMLGSRILWESGSDGGLQAHEINIAPRGQQVILDFQLLTIWYRQLQTDDVPIRLINNGNYVCYYAVHRLLGNGQTQQMPIVNPWPGACGDYVLDVGQQLIVKPVDMARYLLVHDPQLTCLDAPAAGQGLPP